MNHNLMIMLKVLKKQRF